MIDPDPGMGETTLEFAVVTFSAVLFVVDPFAAIPIFVSITHGDALDKRRQAARRSALAAFVTLTAFAFAGGLIFQALGVSLGAFQIAGGIMLLLMAVDMMRATPSRTRSTEEEQRESVAKDDVAIVPMAIPILSGPGAIATVMVFMHRAAWRPLPTLIVVASVALTCLASWLVLDTAARAHQFIGATILRVLDRVMGLLLAAVAVQFVIGGLRDVFPSLR
jgi:multiple antibiotic resistance protein